MTSDFVEQFGFSEEEFAEQEECIGWVAINCILKLTAPCRLRGCKNRPLNFLAGCGTRQLNQV